MLILYGSQTGSTESFAQIVYSFAKMRNIENVRLCSGQDYMCDSNNVLKNEPLIVFLTSTFYNGEFPDNMIKVWKYIQDAEKDAFAKTEFAVFGLGNSTTKGNFCVAAKNISDKMKVLGATELLEPCYSDEYSENGHEANFRPWMKSLWIKLTGSNVKMSLPSHYEITFGENSETKVEETTGFTVAKNEVLTPADNTDRVVHHITMELPKGETYLLTDHVNIHPVNSPTLVNRLAKRMQLDLGTNLELKALDGQNKIPNGVNVGELFSKYLDISAPPSRSFLEGMSTLTTDATEMADIEKMATDMTQGNLFSKMTGGGSGRDSFTLVDCLELYANVEMKLEHLLGNIPMLQPRLYSICSAPSVSPNLIEICFTKEEWIAEKSSKKFTGVCSGYLAGLSAGAKVKGKVVRGLLNLPKDSATPIVGIALGTGIAVFRAILQHRETLLDANENVSRMILYYGIRRAKHDFLFQSTMQGFIDKGLLDLIPACSHDQEKFITPADKIKEIPSKVTDYLDNGGYYIYCGLGGLVPMFHEEAVIAALATPDDVTAEAAFGKINDLKNAKRWQVEAYSRSLDEDNTLKTFMDQADSGKPMADRMEGSKMFCFQCGQTNKGTGCTTVGVCGKTPNLAALQDLIIDNLKRLSWYIHRIKTLEAKDFDAEKELTEINRFTLQACFATLTNVNFDENRMLEYIEQAGDFTEQSADLYKSLCEKSGKEPEPVPKRVTRVFRTTTSRNKQVKENSQTKVDMEDLVSEGRKVGVLSRFRATRNDALVGLQEMLVYGLKGLCAYTDHSLQYGNERSEVYWFIHEAFSFLLSPDSQDLNQVLGMLMKCGTVNLTSMKLLHESNNINGTQTPGKAQCSPKPGKAILISGHDLKILGDLLRDLAKYKEETGIHINVYTHGEMLPAHGYPLLRKSAHLAGHYGWAWQRQSVEFGHFPGPIIMTTNCLTAPKEEYSDRMWTAGSVGWPSIKHISGSDYSPLIKCAADMKGFSEEDKKFDYPENPFVNSVSQFDVGWGMETVIGAAGVVLDEVSKGNISRFYVIGGCDGYEGERSYYTDLAKALPDTSVVLTVGCGKYRLNHLEYGTVGETGIPRVLDLGQCNDSYSAVQIAVALAGALNCGVNDLPLSIVLSWFEQKAVVVLLSLLSLGIKNIRVGPTIPAFLRPSIIKVLNEKFNLMPIGTDVQADIAMMTGGGGIS